MTTKEKLTALEIAKIACNIENDGSDFYRAAAEATQDDKAKKLFNDLAQKEIEHSNAYLRMFNEINERTGGDAVNPGYLFDDSLTGYLKVISGGMKFPRGEAAKKCFAHPHEINDILQFAIEAEKNTVLFFMDILSHETFAYSRELLEGIIIVEKSYIVELSHLMKNLK